jgi:hypothetical protein
MMQIVVSRFVCAIMNTEKRSQLSQPIGNKKRNNLPIERIRNIKNVEYKM